MANLNHFDAEGNARMVDVSAKAITHRTAQAAAKVRMNKTTAALIASGEVKKGDVLGTARLAGIMGCKQTPQLIPLCHPIAVSSVDIEFRQIDLDDFHDVEILATVSCIGATGVEMEALTAVTTAALTVYDMCKSVDREMEIHGIRLIEKTGGASGNFIRSENKKEN